MGLGLGLGIGPVPFPGFLYFFIVSEPVSKKFGTEKSLGTGLEKIWYRKKSQNRSRKKFGTEKSLGTGPEKIWYRKKSRNRSWKKIGTEKSLGTGHRNIWSRSRNFPVSRLSHLTFSNLLYPFLIFTSQFLVRILVSVWVSVSVSSRSRDFCIFWMVSEPVSKKFGTGKSPGIGLGKI